MPPNLDIVGQELDAHRFTYDSKDVILYALGCGAGADELDYLSELEDLKVLPTFAVVPAMSTIMDVIGRAKVNMLKLVHGEQRTVLHRPLPTAGELSTRATVTGIYDKGKAALVVVDTRTDDSEGTHLVDTTWSLFCRGDGGFGGERGPDAERILIPEGAAPDFSYTQATTDTQALLYRLSGDLNPIHASNSAAEKAGLGKPILHGLCTYGFMARAFLRAACDGQPKHFRSLSGRFSGMVYPGDTLICEGWKRTEGGYAVQVRTEGGERPVFSNGLAEVAD